MKSCILHSLPLLLFWIFNISDTIGQKTICYPLSDGLDAVESDDPPLRILENTQGQDGAFAVADLPPNLCPEGGTTTAFHFEDNAGLAFDNNLASLIDCDYTVEFTVNFKELPANTLFDSPWIWVFGTYNDDDGLFIWRDILFGRIYLEFWDSNDRLQSIPFDDFNTTDWFHFTITRNCAGQVSVYVNCEHITDFNDTRNVLRLHPSTGNTMIFFQDDPSVLVGDSAPGIVRDIRVSDFVKEETAVAEQCDCLCEALVDDCTVTVTRDSLTCDPAIVGTTVDTIPFNSPCACQCDSIIITNYQLLSPIDCMPACEDFVSADTLLCLGSFFNNLVISQDTTICDTILNDANCFLIECTNISLLAPAFGQLDTVICVGESVSVANQTFSANGNYTIPLIAANGCDSTLLLNLTVLEQDTTFVDTLVCPGAVVENVLIERDTFFCNTVTGGLNCEAVFCYQVTTAAIPSVQIQEAICPGSSFTFGDTVLTDPGLYTRTFTGSGGCDSLVQLQLDTIPTPTTFVDTTLCLGSALEGVLVLSDTTICTTIPGDNSCLEHLCYRVTVDAVYITERYESVCRGEPFILGDSTYYAPGTFIHPLQAANGCDSIIALVLSDRLPPIISISGSPTLCPGKTSVLNAGSGFAAYEWLPTGETSQIIELQSPGTYRVQVTDEFGCRNVDSIEVIEVPPVELDIALPQQVSCPDSEDGILEAIASGGTPPYRYQWNDGSTSMELAGIGPGFYHATVRDEEGCTSRDTIMVSAPEPFDWDLSLNHPSCPEYEDGVISVEIRTGATPFLFRLNEEPFSPDAVFSGLNPGSYTVSAEDMNGCRQSRQVELVPLEPATVAISPATSSIADGDSVRLELLIDDPETVQSIRWMPSGLVDCESCLSVSVKPDTTVEISALLTDINGCLITATARINVLPPEDPPVSQTDDLFFLPNVFSPNQDGVNDRFFLYAKPGMVDSYQIGIFDRWGNQIFSTEGAPEDPASGWDGNISSAQLAPAGVYVWKIRVNLANGQTENMAGSILLIR